MFLHKNNFSKVWFYNGLCPGLDPADCYTSTVLLSTGFASASATGAAMIPTSALGTASPTQTGSATNVRIGSCAALLIGVAGFFMTM